MSQKLTNYLFSDNEDEEEVANSDTTSNRLSFKIVKKTQDYQHQHQDDDSDSEDSLDSISFIFVNNGPSSSVEEDTKKQQAQLEIDEIVDIGELEGTDGSTFSDERFDKETSSSISKPQQSKEQQESQKYLKFFGGQNSNLSLPNSFNFSNDKLFSNLRNNIKKGYLPHVYESVKSQTGGFIRSGSHHSSYNCDTECHSPTSLGNLDLLPSFDDASMCSEMDYNNHVGGSIRAGSHHSMINCDCPENIQLAHDTLYPQTGCGRDVEDDSDGESNSNNSSFDVDSSGIVPLTPSTFTLMKPR